jgi:type IV secretory pathway VirB10-like protein
MSSVSLEEIVKNNLATYESREANDWARMETMLGATPDSSPFNWKPVLIVAIVLGVLGGGYVAFTSIDFSKMFSKSKPTETPIVKKQPEAPVKKVVPPPTPAPAPAPVVVNTDSIKKAEEEAAAVALAAKEEEERQQREIAEKEEARLKKERRKEKQESNKEEVDLRRTRRRSFENTDSNKTTQSTSKEEKAAEKKNTHIGLNIFSTINADSLKKALEKSKKDSVK